MRGELILLGDSHYGVRGDKELFHGAHAKFLSEKFFPYLEEHSDRIAGVVHLGDVVDRRKYVNFQSLNRLRTDFIEPLRSWAAHREYAHREYGSVVFIAGNHDVYYRNSNAVNALDELIGPHDHFCVVSREPVAWYFSGVETLLVPWINNENREKSLSAIRDSRAPLALGHFELSGHEMYRGQPALSGDDPALLERFQLVCSGHYHHRSRKDNVQYIGALGEYTWSDYDDPRGFASLDLDTMRLTFIDNRDRLHVKVEYDDVNGVLPPVNDLKDKIVRVLVQRKLSQSKLDAFVSEIESQGPDELRVIESESSVVVNSSVSIDNNAPTMDVVRSVVEDVETESDKELLMALLHELHAEAVQNTRQ